MAVWTGLEPATSAVTGRHSKPTELPDHLQWRRQRDLNPRAGYPTYSLSRGASSASWVCLHRTAYLIYHIDLGYASIFCIKIINLKWKIKFHFRRVKVAFSLSHLSSWFYSYSWIYFYTFISWIYSHRYIITVMSVSLFHERLIIMAKSNKNLHLTLSERQIIQRGIENGATKASIAATLGKDKWFHPVNVQKRKQSGQCPYGIIGGGMNCGKHGVLFCLYYQIVV